LYISPGYNIIMSYKCLPGAAPEEAFTAQISGGHTHVLIQMIKSDKFN
jgi:hypothetical protein